MCIRVLTIFKCACPHRNTLVCPHHIHIREPPSTADLKTPSRPSTSSGSSESPENNTTSSISDDDFQKDFQPRLPSALQGHKAWTPLPGKENQRWEHCPGYVAKSRALALATSAAPGGKSGSSGTSGSGEVTAMGKETQCAEYKATEPKFRRRWEVKSGLCEECRGMHGMDGPPGQDGEGRNGREEEVGKGKEEERGRRSRAATDPTLGAVSVPVSVDGENVVKEVSGKVVGRRAVRKRIATL